MALKNIFKIIKNKIKNLKESRHTKLQTKYVVYQKATEHLKELKARYLQLPTKDLNLEIHQFEKKVVEINMKYIKFYEGVRNKALSKSKKEIDKVTD